MSDTYTEISSRLADLRPPVQIASHIGDRKKLKVAVTVLDGITFQPKDKKKLLEALRQAKDRYGMPAFAEARIDNEPHWALKLSFGATHGTGFRETWRLPPLTSRPLDNAGDPYARQSAGKFAAHFGDRVDLPNLTSLHCAVADDVCNIHIDQTGFVVESPDGNIALTPDFFQHLMSELVLKTNLKGLAPRWSHSVFDRVSLVYPNSANNYERMGPRVGQVPVLREAGRLGVVGPVLKRVPLPGVSVDLVKAKTYKLTFTASCGVNGNCSTTLTLGGTHNLFGSK